MTIELTHITWETDGQNVELPQELTINIDIDDTTNDYEITDTINDYLSNNYGYLVENYFYNIKEIK